MNLDQAAVLAALTLLVADEDVEKVGHDVKYDAIVLARHGVVVGGPGFDTMLASYLIDSTRAPHALEDLSLTYLGYKPLTEEGVYGKGAKATAAADLPASASLAYAGERADLPLQLARVLRETLAAAQLDEVYRTLEWPLVPVLVDLEQVGVRVDTAVLASLSQMLEREMESRSARIFELAGETFNINSPKQLGEILFERLSLPVLKKTGTTKAASTSVEVLGGARADARTAAAHPRLALDAEAEGHLRRRAARPREPEDRPRAHQLQPGRGRDGSAQQLRPEPAEHPRADRARPWRSAARSSRTPAACSSRPTTRRSSCGCWRTCRATRR